MPWMASKRSSHLFPLSLHIFTLEAPGAFRRRFNLALFVVFVLVLFSEISTVLAGTSMPLDSNAIVCRINDKRKQSNTILVKVDPKLMQSSLAAAQDLTKNRNCPIKVGERVTKAGMNWFHVAEVRGFQCKDANECIGLWFHPSPQNMATLDPKKTLFNATYNKIGVGVVEDPKFQGRYTYIIHLGYDGFYNGEFPNTCPPAPPSPSTVQSSSTSSYVLSSPTAVAPSSGKAGAAPAPVSVGAGSAPTASSIPSSTIVNDIMCGINAERKVLLKSDPYDNKS